MSPRMICPVDGRHVEMVCAAAVRTEFLPCPASLGHRTRGIHVTGVAPYVRTMLLAASLVAS